MSGSHEEAIIPVTVSIRIKGEYTELLAIAIDNLREVAQILGSDYQCSVKYKD